MRVLVTGMIAGLGEEQYIKKVINLGKDDGVCIQYYNLLKCLQSTSGTNRLMGATNYLFEVLREREYAKIGCALADDDCENAIIRVPATIAWNHVNHKLKDHKIIKEIIKPDVVVTLIDAEWTIRKRLGQGHFNDPFRKQINEENPSIQHVLRWMNEEVSLSEDWAKYFGVPHYVIPMAQHPWSLYKLIKHPNIPSFYVSYSMTHADDEARKKINEVVLKLCDYGLVIDPQAIEIGHQKMSSLDKEFTYSFTVHRDLHWFVGKVDSVVAIHPYDTKPPLSTGMMDELGHARDYMKNRYMIFPPEHLSPFTTNSYVDKGCVFKDAKSFFIALEEEGYEQLEDLSNLELEK